jgi:hypothetical protein
MALYDLFRDDPHFADPRASVLARAAGQSSGRDGGLLSSLGGEGGMPLGMRILMLGSAIQSMGGRQNGTIPQILQLHWQNAAARERGVQEAQERERALRSALAFAEKTGNRELIEGLQSGAIDPSAVVKIGIDMVFDAYRKSLEPPPPADAQQEMFERMLGGAGGTGEAAPPVSSGGAAPPVSSGGAEAAGPPVSFGGIEFPLPGEAPSFEDAFASGPSLTAPVPETRAEPEDPQLAQARENLRIPDLTSEELFDLRLGGAKNLGENVAKLREKRRAAAEEAQGLFPGNSFEASVYNWLISKEGADPTKLRQFALTKTFTDANGVSYFISPPMSDSDRGSVRVTDREGNTKTMSLEELARNFGADAGTPPAGEARIPAGEAQAPAAKTFDDWAVKETAVNPAVPKTADAMEALADDFIQLRKLPASRRSATAEEAKGRAIWAGSYRSFPAALENFDALSEARNTYPMMVRDRLPEGMQLERFAMSERGKRATDAIKNVVIAYTFALSGAQTPEKEWERNFQLVMPHPADGPEVVAAKKEILKGFMDTIKMRTVRDIPFSEAMAPIFNPEEVLANAGAAQPGRKPEVAMPPGDTMPPPEAFEFLRKNPDKRRLFDERYGAGWADYVLGRE